MSNLANDGGARHRPPQTSHEGAVPPDDAKEFLVQKLQDALHAIRRDRDQEHRQRDMGLERLRSVNEAKESTRDSLGEEKAKYEKTCAESKDRQQNVHALHEEIEVLKHKVRGGECPVMATTSSSSVRI